MDLSSKLQEYIVELEKELENEEAKKCTRFYDEFEDGLVSGTIYTLKDIINHLRTLNKQKL